MRTYGLTTKIRAKKPKNVRNCESWVSGNSKFTFLGVEAQQIDTAQNFFQRVAARGDQLKRLTHQVRSLGVYSQLWRHPLGSFCVQVANWCNPKATPLLYASKHTVLDALRKTVREKLPTFNALWISRTRSSEFAGSR